MLENRFWDYTKTDIADKSGVSRMQLYRFWDTIEKLELVKVSRKFGATILFQTNLESPIIRKLSALSIELADQRNKELIKVES